LESAGSKSGRFASLGRAWRRYDASLKGRWPRGRWVAHGVTALVALSLVASALKEPTPAAAVVPSATPSQASVAALATAVATSTVQPTAMPTATATPEATPDATEAAVEEATAEPVPTISKAEMRWATFTSHVSDSAPALVGPLNDLSTAATDMDFDGLESSSTELKRMATDELTWLGNHPPAACYATVHDTYTSGLKKLRSAASSMLKFLATYDIDQVSAANDALVSGNELIGEATTELHLVDCS
jgi:hypothetical protein